MGGRNGARHGRENCGDAWGRSIALTYVWFDGQVIVGDAREDELEEEKVHSDHLVSHANLVEVYSKVHGDLPPF